VFWIHRRAAHARGADRPALLLGLELDPRSGRIVARRSESGARRPLDEDAWIEPEILAESLAGDRAVRLPIDLDALPEAVWRAVLAAEDARFFSHPGVDARAVARAALRNLRAGRVAEGGSTITQQLIKTRDLTPKRSLGRKASEAMRALALEAEHDKREILQAYLNTVYLGHSGGLAVHGIGAAARAWFSKPAANLSLAEAAALAGMIQAPNRLTPTDHAAALRPRRDWVLGRMAELGWATAGEVERARQQPVLARPTPPGDRTPRHLVQWVARHLEIEASWRSERGWGFLVETTVDPWLQDLAADAVGDGLAALRRAYPRLRAERLQAALVALDARSGAVLAYVGGDPAAAPGAAGVDRVRALRQPGSVVKPFVVLEALDRCGRRAPLTASSRIADRPLTIETATGPWRPENFDDRFLGTVLLREAIAESRNVPAVRIARWCGFEATAETFARLGLDLPESPPPSFVLGAVEASPLAIARAYTVLATPGRVFEPFAVARVETSAGRGVDREGADDRRAASREAAYIVRDLLRTAVAEGTATGGALRGSDVAAKTGSSSLLRDAWFAGHAGSVVAVVWVGLDGGGRVGLTGAQAAAPLWRAFMTGAVPARAPYDVERPRDIEERWVETGTGLLVAPGRAGARPELYRRGTLPDHRRWWRVDRPLPPIE
jgi:penicillin-binding protein 1B